MLSLTKGQTISLAKGGPSLTRIAMGLGWDERKPTGLLGRLFGSDPQGIDLDASCLMFDANKNMVDAIWFRQLTSKDGSISHSGDNRTGAGDGDDETITVDLTRVPARVTTLIFTVNSFQGDTFEKISNAGASLYDLQKNTKLAEFNLSDSGKHTGLVMCSLKRRQNDWEMTAIGVKAKGATFQNMMSDILPHV